MGSSRCYSMKKRGQRDSRDTHHNVDPMYNESNNSFNAQYYTLLKYLPGHSWANTPFKGNEGVKG